MLVTWKQLPDVGRDKLDDAWQDSETFYMCRTRSQTRIARVLLQAQTQIFLCIMQTRASVDECRRISKKTAETQILRILSEYEAINMHTVCLLLKKNYWRALDFILERAMFVFGDKKMRIRLKRSTDKQKLFVYYMLFEHLFRKVILEIPTSFVLEFLKFSRRRLLRFPTVRNVVIGKHTLCYSKVRLIRMQANSRNVVRHVLEHSTCFISPRPRM